MKYLIANWKAHKSLKDVEGWLSTFKDLALKLENKDLTIILASSFPHLGLVKEAIVRLPNCHVASQSISSEKAGSFTGEVTADSLVGLAEYCIVGHSERRKRGETVEQIEAQIKNLRASGIVPILCISSEAELPEGYEGMVAYEQPEAIGTGKNTSVDEVMKVYKNLNLAPESIFLYGASVDENNCKEYLERSEIKGFIVGTASLQPDQFMRIASLL